MQSIEELQAIQSVDIFGAASVFWSIVDAFDSLQFFDALGIMFGAVNSHLYK